MASSIVCALDDSAHGRAVAETALTLAVSLDLDSVFVHVAEDPSTIPAGATADRERARHLEIERARRAVDDVLDQQIKGAGEVIVDARIGDPASEVLRVARERDAALVVVGARRLGRFRALFSRSVSGQVIEGSDRPVVVVPSSILPGSEAAALSGDSVVCGVDASTTAGNQAVKEAGGLAHALDLRLVLVHCVSGAYAAARAPLGSGTFPISPTTAGGPADPEPPAVLVHAAREVSTRDVHLTAKVETAPPHKAIARSAGGEHAALVVIGAGDEPGHPRSTPQLVMRDVDVPVMVVPGVVPSGPPGADSLRIAS
jgi:nucleotide-binding universal stress UspA family protein